ncbi:class I SAM-dependent methyltransferase [Flavobacterium saliperosum]|uniref:Methyltransferase domain-containing protein n=1 Tax=Flavobacterium saliperosum TaxID=329186 RepID=A0A1G4VTY5_9FLAO|nr:class I SAM-dependent methyltransferase [Flavobacterium saliperosum]SCX11080.1 Methyltransferase domain-containing protein [Flavobacterium saliperosum]
MQNNSHKESFLSYEADAWFERNKSVINNYKPESDKVLELIKNYGLQPQSILEIGCSAGYRLNAIKTLLPNSEVFGIEPSSRAIEYGKSNYSDVNFVHGTADNLSHFETESLDIVIVGFVFYVIDRNILLKVVAEIDRVLKNGGILIIVDFFSESSLKNVYQHIEEFNAYSFKQNYDEIFTATKLYYLLDKSTWSHSEKALDATSNYYDKYSVSLLKKDFEASYK